MTERLVLRPELVIFDCDGVLVDSEGIFGQVLARNLSENGLPISPADVHRLFLGGTISNVRQRAIEMGAVLDENWVSEFYAEAEEELKKGTPLVDGICQFLDRLDAVTIPCCVASNGRMSKMRITLGQNGLMDRFGGQIFSAYEVGVAKPDPGLFLHAAKMMGVSPAKSMVIEDSANGVMAAQRAGISCFAYAPNGDGKHLAALGARVFTSMYELPSLLGI